MERASLFQSIEASTGPQSARYEQKEAILEETEASDSELSSLMWARWGHATQAVEGAPGVVAAG